MKKLINMLAVIIMIITAPGCKKAAAVTTSQWTLDGKTYTGTTTIFAGNYLESNDYVSDTVADIILIAFSQRPTANGRLAVVNENTQPNSKECIIMAARVTASTQFVGSAVSVGQPGDSVSVTVTNGKIHASFTNIIVEESQNIYTSIAGNLTEQ